MHVEQKVNIHNRFDIHIDNIKTGEHREVTAYNIVLDQMWTMLCGGSSYFTNIHFGTGTGTPTADRTSLFTHLGTKAAVTEETIKAVPLSSWKRKIVLNPEEYVESTITEVGIAYGSSASNLVTHAMLKDSEGNVISITKSDTDVVTIFATVFITFANNIPEVTLLRVPNNNTLINYLVGGSAPTGSFGLNLWSNAYARLGSTASAVWTSDVPNKKRKTNVLRFGTTVGNGNVRNLDFTNLFSLNLPAAGIFTGQPYTNVNIGVGDGVQTKWELPSANIRQSTLGVKINGVLTSAYTLNILPIAADLVPPPDMITWGYAVALSADGSVLAMVGGAASPYLRVWDWSGSEWVLRAQPPSVPAGGWSVALSADGNTLAMGSSNISPYLRVWDWMGSEWVMRAQPPSMPARAEGVALSADGSVLAVGSQDSSPYVSVWDWSGTAWVMRAQPPSVPTNVKSVALSDDGSILAVGSHVSPHLQVWDWTGAEWVLRAQPPSMSTNSFSVALSADGSVLAVGSQNTSPYVRVWDWSGTEWVLRAQPPSVPEWGQSITLSADGSVLVMGSSHISPYVSVWDWSGSEWVLRAQPPSVPAKGYAVALSDDGSVLAVVCEKTPPSLKVWEFDILVSHSITFDAPPDLGDVITADYTVDGVHKTDQYVIDASFAIQFGEGV